jgi:endonuclease G, mitochondrial
MTKKQFIRSRLPPRLGAMLLALAGAIGLWLYDGAQTGRAEAPREPTEKIYAGLPRTPSFSLRNRMRVLENRGFTIGYSELRRNPLWVAYHARPIKRRREYRRPEDFEVDTRTLARVSSRDYSRSGYQRGHLAPSWLIAQLYGREAQMQTFLMSNITPQKPNLNQKVWQRLEEVESDRFARWFDGVWVFTGPIFDDHIQHLRSGVEVPDAFYRIFVDEDPAGVPRVLAFVVPQTVRGDEPLDQFTATVDDIEARTSFDFLSTLEDVLEERIESTPADSRHWRLAEISRLPARY